MRNVVLTIFSLLLLLVSFRPRAKYKIFDVHLHGSKEPAEQLKNLQQAGIYKTAISTSWNLQQAYKGNESLSVLHGLMVPCPNGKVPYSLQTCYDDKMPELKIWIMHAGVPYLDETIRIMKKYPQVYTDISAINNPRIISEEKFLQIIRQLIDNGLEDRIMFGSDNADIDISINSMAGLSFLSETQKQKIFSKNAENFFQAANNR